MGVDVGSGVGVGVGVGLGVAVGIGVAVGSGVGVAIVEHAAKMPIMRDRPMHTGLKNDNRFIDL